MSTLSPSPFPRVIENLIDKLLPGRQVNSVYLYLTPCAANAGIRDLFPVSPDAGNGGVTRWWNVRGVTDRHVGILNHKMLAYPNISKWCTKLNKR